MSRTSSLEIISHKGELPSLDHTRLRKIRKKYLYKFNELWVWYLFATIFYKKNSTQAVRRGRQYLHTVMVWDNVPAKWLGLGRPRTLSQCPRTIVPTNLLI